MKKYFFVEQIAGVSLDPTLASSISHENPEIFLIKIQYLINAHLINSYF